MYCYSRSFSHVSFALSCMYCSAQVTQMRILSMCIYGYSSCFALPKSIQKLVVRMVVQYQCFMHRAVPGWGVLMSVRIARGCLSFSFSLPFCFSPPLESWTKPKLLPTVKSHSQRKIPIRRSPVPWTSQSWGGGSAPNFEGGKRSA
jgi:hypothetical protein